MIDRAKASTSAEITVDVELSRAANAGAARKLSARSFSIVVKAKAQVCVKK